MGRFFGSNRFKFGLFGLNCSGGMTPSRAPERWRADWKDIVKVAQLADEAGVEFLLPIAKWRGLGGEANMWGRSFETFTQAAALGALTRRVGVFVTAHISLITPAFAAKAVATIDHVTQGRAGLNIVCGWNPDEFRLHGISLEGGDRYSRGLEWFRIYDKLLDGGPPFDWTSDTFDMRGLSTDPLPVQRPRPPVMSAAQSGDAQLFAAQVADILFTAMYSFEQVEETTKRAQSAAAELGRPLPVLLQINAGHDPAKFGAELEDTPRLLATALARTHLRVDGFMTIAPLGATPAETADLAARTFANLRELRDRLAAETGAPLRTLSMGMSSDFAAAIAAGSTLVRVGTALFGSR